MKMLLQKNTKMGLIKNIVMYLQCIGTSHLSLPLSFCSALWGCLLRRLSQFAVGLGEWWEADTRGTGFPFGSGIPESSSGKRVERMLGACVTYFIVKRAVGAFLHCALLLLVPNLNDHHRVDVLAHQLAGLDDGYGDLRHKAASVGAGDQLSLHIGSTAGGGGGSQRRGQGGAWKGGAGRKSQSLT